MKLSFKLDFSKGLNKKLNLKINKIKLLKNLSEQKSKLERRLKELEEQEALIESDQSTSASSSSSSSSSTRQTVTNLSSNSQILTDHNNDSVTTTTSANNNEPTTTSLLSQPTSTYSLTDPDEIARRTLEYQNRLLSTASTDHHIFDYARAVEQRKREIAARFGSSIDLIKPAPSISTDSGIQQQQQERAAPDKHTVYSSDSGIGSGTNRANSNGIPDSSSSCLSLLKKPINLAVEQLNSEIQGMSGKINSDSDLDELKRRLSQISTASTSSTSSSLGVGGMTSQSQSQFGLEKYDSNSWTSWSGVDEKSAGCVVAAAHSSSDAESFNDEDSDASDDVSLDQILLANLLRIKPATTSRDAERHAIESQLEVIRLEKESLDQQL